MTRAIQSEVRAPLALRPSALTYCTPRASGRRMWFPRSAARAG